MSVYLCRNPRDEWLNVEERPIWTVVLNNDEVIYGDDSRPGIEPSSAWLRLIDYCRENNLYVVGLDIRFRDHVISLPQNAIGYYFSRGVWAQMISNSSTECFVIGIVEDGRLEVTWYCVPELLEIQKVEKDLTNKNVLDKIIWTLPKGG